MHTSRIFWGTLWIVAGMLILLAKLDVMTFQIGTFWKFWPLVFVFWGISVLTGAKSIRALLAVLAAVLLAVILYGAWEEWGWGGEPRVMTTQTFQEMYDPSLHHASLRFVSDAGTFTIRDTCADLFQAETASDLGKYDIDTRTMNDGKDVTLSMENRRVTLGAGGRNTVTMKLHPAPAWSLKLELGAAKLDADLSSYDAEDVDVRTGAADVRLRLGDRAEDCRVRIQAGVSSITVAVPQSAGCEITSESGLTSKSFRGFDDRGDGEYRTANFDAAQKKIHLTFKAGVSSLRVERY